jgi:hypothetical protein
MVLGPVNGYETTIPVSENAAMKSISASIVVLAGALILVGGSFISRNDTQGVLQLVGGGVGLIGLVVWFRTIWQSEE